jgi:3-hydroxyisobutyrate dehydrogenase-like beta-hydroxyacid dehydrogenase
MGRAAAVRLVEQGHDVTVWNRTPRAVEGATTGASAASVVTHADIALIALFDGPSTQSVLVNALPTVEAPGRVVVDIATKAPNEAEAIARLVTDRGWHYVEAPVLGSVPAVRSGTLKILCGATSDQDVELARPVLDALGDDVRFVGPVGTASRLKLVSNAALALAARATREALALGDALSLAQPEVLDVLSLGHLARIATGKRQRLESGDFDAADFTVSALAKDLQLALEAADEPRAGRLPDLVRTAADVATSAKQWPDADFGRLLV